MSGRHQPDNGADSPQALSDAEYRPEFDGTFWRAWRPDDEGQYASDPGDEETARYASMLLNSGIHPDELGAMLQRVGCTRCERVVYDAETDSSGRCSECQS